MTTRPTSTGSSRSRCSATPTGSPPALRPGQHVAEPVRASRTRGRRSSARRSGSRPIRCLCHAPGEIVPRALADHGLWEAFAAIGIDAVHTGPVKQAGGLNGCAADARRSTATSTASACRSTRVRHRGGVPQLCAIAAEYEGTVIDDIVPGHTGKGADFRLAEMVTATTPASTTWSRSTADDWHLLPDVPDGARLASTSTPRPRQRLERRGYIIGRLQRVIFYEPGVKETNWSATARRHRRRRRRAALGLPALLQGGPALDQLARPVLRRHAAGDRRRAARARRPRRGRPAPGRQRLPRRREVRAEDEPAWSEGHPLSRGRQPPDREHGPQDGRLLLPGAQPRDRRHQGDGRRRAPTCPTTSSTAPPTTTRWSPATPSSCG